RRQPRSDSPTRPRSSPNSALRQDVANLERVVYAPTIHARPDQVAPTMNEALRVARADSWVTTGQDISRG
ncbi:MAG TPA: hypothetical protein PLP95_06265, partial [Microthrixaceae bacterium]|nr:hypothetical protein [Microthrixaceae bacterium]